MQKPIIRDDPLSDPFSVLNAKTFLVLPPISTKNLTADDVDNLTRRTRDSMLDALIALTESPLGQKATKASVTAKEENLAAYAMKHGIVERKNSRDKREKR